MIPLFQKKNEHIERVLINIGTIYTKTWNERLLVEKKPVWNSSSRDKCVLNNLQK